MNIDLQRFYERVAAELRIAIDEVAWWSDLVARERVSPEHARGHIDAAENIIRTKRLILNFP
jgi:hypothetical protein